MGDERHSYVEVEAVNCAVQTRPRTMCDAPGRTYKKLLRATSYLSRKHRESVLDVPCKGDDTTLHRLRDGYIDHGCT